MSHDRKAESKTNSLDTSSLLKKILAVAEHDEMTIQATLQHELKTADNDPVAIIKAVQKATKQLIQKEIKDNQAENPLNKASQWLQRKLNKPTFLTITQNFLNDHLLSTVRTLMPQDNKWNDNDFKEACAADAKTVDYDIRTANHIRFNYDKAIAKEDYTLRNPFFLAAMMYLWQHNPKKNLGLFEIQMCFLQHLDLTRQGFQVKINEIGEEKKLKISIKSHATQRSCNFFEDIDFKRENIIKNPYFPKDSDNIMDCMAIPAILSHLSEQQETYLRNQLGCRFWDSRNIHINFGNPTSQPEMHLLYFAELLSVYRDTLHNPRDTKDISIKSQSDHPIMFGLYENVSLNKHNVSTILEIYQHLCLIDGNLLSYLDTIRNSTEQNHCFISTATLNLISPDNEDDYYMFCSLLSFKGRTDTIIHPSRYGNLYHAIGKAINSSVPYQDIQNFIETWNNAHGLVQEVILSVFDQQPIIKTGLTVGQSLHVFSSRGDEMQYYDPRYEDTLDLILEVFKSTMTAEFEMLFNQLPPTVRQKFVLNQSLGLSNDAKIALIAEFNRFFAAELNKAYATLIANQVNTAVPAIIPDLSAVVSGYCGGFFAKDDLDDNLERKDADNKPSGP